MSPTLDSALDALVAGHKGPAKEITAAICDAVKADWRFKHLNPALVAEEVTTYVESLTGGFINIRSAVEGIHKIVRLQPGALLKSESWITKISNDFHSLPTEHKVNAGMWGVGALLGAFGFIGSARNSVAKDSEGKNQVQWSNVGVALLQAALAAGCAYMGTQALRVAHAH